MDLRYNLVIAGVGQLLPILASSSQFASTEANLDAWWINLLVLMELYNFNLAQAVCVSISSPPPNVHSATYSQSSTDTIAIYSSK